MSSKNSADAEKKTKEDEGVLLDIEYELESIRTDEINYHYILSLIQALIENRENLIGKKEKSSGR